MTAIASLPPLIHSWCDRRELRALSILLPSYLTYNGLTDGLAALVDGLANTAAYAHDRLPADEQTILNATLREARRALVVQT